MAFLQQSKITIINLIVAFLMAVSATGLLYIGQSLNNCNLIRTTVFFASMLWFFFWSVFLARTLVIKLKKILFILCTSTVLFCVSGLGRDIAQKINKLASSININNLELYYFAMQVALIAIGIVFILERITRQPFLTCMIYVSIRLSVSIAFGVQSTASEFSEIYPLVYNVAFSLAFGLLAASVEVLHPVLSPGSSMKTPDEGRQ